MGWSAIHVASVNRQPEILKILLENGADPDLTDEFVNIYQTAREKNLQSLDVMVAREEEFNSNLNLRANFRGCTALHYAALADDYESIRILLGLCNLFVCLLVFFVCLFVYFFLDPWPSKIWILAYLRPSKRYHRGFTPIHWDRYIVQTFLTPRPVLS